MEFRIFLFNGSAKDIRYIETRRARSGALYRATELQIEQIGDLKVRRELVRISDSSTSAEDAFTKVKSHIRQRCAYPVSEVKVVVFPPSAPQIYRRVSVKQQDTIRKQEDDDGDGDGDDDNIQRFQWPEESFREHDFITRHLKSRRATRSELYPKVNFSQHHVWRRNLSKFGAARDSAPST